MNPDIVRVGFTGTQVGCTAEQGQRLKLLLGELFRENVEFHHGDCLGSDAFAGRMAYWLGYRVVIHPPISVKKRAFTNEYEVMREEKPYLKRNKEIVDETDVLIATPRGEEVKRSGTWSTIRYARKQSKRVLIVWPDGSQEQHIGLTK